MALEVHRINTGDVELDSSFLVLMRDPGKRLFVPTYAYLILGGEAPILVDSGFRNEEIMKSLGMQGRRPPEMALDAQLHRYGLKLSDIKYVVHTHLHIDHAGQDDKFPMSTTVVVNRRELEYSVSGLMHPQYPAEDIKHLIDRLHTKNSLRLLDLDITGEEEIIPGVTCVLSGAHTEGHMNIMVSTSDGVACICGDVFYDIYDQMVMPSVPMLADEPWPTGNHGTTKRQERAAIKKIINSSRAIFPCHTRGALVEQKRVVAALDNSWPGTILDLSELQKPYEF